jgi:Leucine-rich repeat (LRR) protein
LKYFISIFTFLCCLFSGINSYAQVVSREALDTMPIFKSVSIASQNPDQVYRLDLSKQKLQHIPEEVWSFKNLQELILTKNRLLVIPDEIASLKYLQVFVAEHNEIEKIPAALLSLTNLRELDLADNLVSIIPENIDHLANLEVLALWDNPIEYYPESLSDLPNLKVLDLLHNQISSDTQERLKSTLSEVKVIMSPPCACQDGDD